MSFLNIPLELRALNQWCVWRWEDKGAPKPDKPPYNPITGEYAKSNDPSTWCTFEQAINNKFTSNVWEANEDIKQTGYTGIGFFFSENGPYAGIDLDDVKGDQIKLNRQIDIYREFDSYSEKSPSGTGLHIIVKGKVLAGRKRNSIEIYSSGRFFTMTGNVYNDKPIVDRQQQLTQLWQQMGDGPVAMTMHEDENEKLPDIEIKKQCESASNGLKFSKLFNGEWQSDYQSQSEADFAIIDIIAFYTKNRNQIARLFHASQLGQRSKAKRSDYLAWMINKSFDRMLPPIDFDGFRNQLELKLAEGRKQEIVIEPTLPGIVPSVVGPIAPSAISVPPGLLGELAQFVYQAAPRQVADIALAGAIAFMAGIVGKAYNISGGGLNHYVLVLAKTGRGKEAVAIGVDKIMNTIKTWCPTSSRIRGPAVISSGQALVRYLSEVSSCCVSILGEVGITIERISNKRAIPSDKMLYQMLLDLYHKSGHGQTLPGSAYSKKENDIKSIQAPAFSIFGESTHKIFYETLTEDMISAGLLPRFLIFDYEGKREYFNKDHHLVKPDRFMIDKVTSLVAYAEQIMSRNEVCEIQCDEASQKILDDYDTYTTDKINQEKNDVIAELWNRAHIKVMRLAGLIAVGVNHLNPLVTVEFVKYAMNLVQNDIHLLSAKFNSGMVGANSEENKQILAITERIKEYLTRPWSEIKSYCPSCAQMHHERIIPYEYFSTRVSMLAVFKNDKIGQTNALRRCVQTLIDNGKLEEITKTKQYADQYKRGSKRAFIVKDEVYQ